MLLSILIPVYNERTVVEKSLALVLSAPLPENMDRELVIVDELQDELLLALGAGPAVSGGRPGAAAAVGSSIAGMAIAIAVSISVAVHAAVARQVRGAV